MPKVLLPFAAATTGQILLAEAKLMKMQFLLLLLTVGMILEWLTHLLAIPEP